MEDPPPIAPIRRESSMKRNGPCPCGSGNKSKKCCLPKARDTEVILNRISEALKDQEAEEPADA